MKKVTLAVAALAISASVSAVAATPGAYVGLGLGASRLETPAQNLINPAPTGLSQSTSRGGLGGRIFTGYNFNQYIGAELGLATYAQSKYTASAPGFNAKATYDMTALDLIAKAYLPISNTGFNLYALGGAALVYSKDKDNVQFAGTNYSSSTTTRKVRPKYGVGASYDINSNVSTSLEWSRIQGIGNVQTSNTAIPNADMISLNVSYNFG